jgi:4-diphosphocytidyl-2-C-methyl-D-erythritol kinase
LTDIREPAFAKVNLCLFLGEQRDDGRHELVTLFESLGLRDDLAVTASDADQVVCEGVDGPNLVGDALHRLRAAGWDAPPVRVQITKRIPVAGGMGGGSADAAALLRLAPRLAPVPAEVLAELAVDLGADVPSQLAPGPSIGTGAGQVLQPVWLDAHGLLVLPQPFGLSTATVYREADRLRLGRARPELASLRAELRAEIETRGPLSERLIVNDLQPAAMSLAPQIEDALAAARAAGARPAIVCGAGPTVIGLFWGPDGTQRAQAAARNLQSRFPSATATEPVVERGTAAHAERVRVSRNLRSF